MTKYVIMYEKDASGEMHWRAYKKHLLWLEKLPVASWRNVQSCETSLEDYVYKGIVRKVVRELEL